ERRRELGVPFQGPVELVEVPVIEGAPGRLPKLVLSDRVDTALSHELRVAAVDQLGDDPRLRVGRLDPVDDRPPRGATTRSERGIEAPAVDATIQPETHDVD